MQKAKVEWLKFSDANTAYFHKVVKSQASRNRIDSVTASNGVCVDGDQVSLAFINHYTEFLGQQGVISDFNSIDLFSKQLSNDVANYMIHGMFDQEIREAIFYMGDNKAPGPDGYSIAFFKEAWDIIEADVTKAIKEFFINGVLLKELNHTIIALILKVTNPMRINDYRPISCCNVLYKCISRIISNRMKESLTSLLMHNYHLDRSTPRCAFKVDIQKAYDTVDLMFLKEVLTLMLHRKARDSDFTYHRYYSKLKIINLCFADDLFLFAHGDVDSAWVIMDTLEEFKKASGLTPSLPKSTTYFCNVLNHVKLNILQILPFEEGKLPIKYLGVPLVPSRLLYRDCMELMEKVKRRINDWKNKSLSLAGRAQLIRSVLSSTYIYWASVFILPSGLMLELEQLIRGFLWCQCEIRKGKAKVAWEDSLLLRKESLFVKWIHTYKLNGRTLWEIPLLGKMSWGWRKILQIYRAGLGLSDKVNEIIVSGMWKWPAEWTSKYLMLANLAVLNLSNASDGLLWRHISNDESNFSVAKAWECIWPRANDVDWFHVVWFSHQIPRHAIYLWLVIRRKLKTQDMLRQWDVWNHMKSFIGIPNFPSDLSSIVDFLIPLAKMRSARSVGNLVHVVRGLEVGWLVECSPRAVLLFPSPRFFPLGFTWKGFLRRQYRLACINPTMLHRDGSGDLCNGYSLKDKNKAKTDKTGHGIGKSVKSRS
ncbi:hypothetical protein Tco_1232408 [Tanacetum coccineum]